jgi:hypothetical protein
MVQIFTVTLDQLENIYLGETIRLFEEDDQLKIEPYIIEDFANHFTTMGQKINTVLGKVTSIEDTNPSIITLLIDGEIEVCSYYGNEVFEVEKLYEFDLVNFIPEETSILSFYHPDSKIEMTITALNRSENGELMLSTLDNNGGEYFIGTSSPQKNFNLSELRIGDSLIVYADAVMESWPMQVNTRKIIKN